MSSTERILKALANRRRLAIVSHLKHRRSAAVGELADLLKVTFPTTSKHLSILSAADIVEYERRSLQVYYHLADNMPSVARSILRHL
ncbi:MAG: winged helix-turn-helix transcriptional regulator [Candidatus Kerfeldbacteria bacterium]|nr:winged helix-turn-helix transcriptional regulator [Candidatus Kerfeldbacteria bacterium]